MNGTVDKQKPQEVICEMCNGAGLIPRPDGCMKVGLCPQCAGHGVLAVTPKGAQVSYAR